MYSEPEVHQFTLPLTGGRIIIASDGLWDTVNPKTSCHHIRGMGSTQGGKALVGDKVGVLVLNFTFQSKFSHLFL